MRLYILLLELLASVCITRAQDYPPVFTVNPPRLVVLGVNTVKVRIQAVGQPAPACRWMRNDKDFDPTETEGAVVSSARPGDCSLTFINPKTEYEGFWSAFAQSGENIAKSDTFLLFKAVLQEFSNFQSTFRREAGQGLRIQCPQPRSYPKAALTWNYKKAGMISFKSIDFDDRIGLDPDGGLNFMWLDSTDTGQYQCEVYNSVLQRSAKSEPWTVNVIGEAGDKQIKPVPIWAVRTQESFIRGESASIMCVFSGKPTPTIIWSKNNEPVPASASIRSYGLELYFESIGYEDAGAYDCSAINLAQPQPRKQVINVNVIGKVIWDQKPISKTAGEGESVQIVCAGEGNPNPSPPKWFINTQQIGNGIAQPANYEFTDEYGPSTVLRITNLSSERDTKTLQCNITNDVVVGSYVYTNFYINVKTEAPSIVDFDEGPHKWAETRMYTLKCKVFGAPTPIISWTKDGQALTGGRYQIQPDGSLQVQNVSITDAGFYTCSARNEVKNETEWRRAKVIVRRPTVIKQPPEDLTVTAGTQAKFICTALTDADESQHLTISWLKDGNNIVYTVNSKLFMNVQDNSLQIASPTATDSGSYTCVASNGIDTDEKSATLRVQDVPGAPFNVNILKCQSTTATIEWEPGVNHNAPLTNYILQYRTTHDFSVWYTARDDIVKNTQISVPLKPGNVYYFRVLAQNKIGRSPPSGSTPDFCETPDGAPKSNPKGQRTVDKGLNILHIAWQAMSQIDFGGSSDGFGYEVWYRRKGETSCWKSTSATWCMKNKGSQEGVIGTPGELNLNEYSVEEDDGVGVYQAFDFKVKAKNADGSAPDPPTLIGYSGEGDPGQQVVGFKVKTLDGVEMVYSNNATFTWLPVDESDSLTNGFFRGYMIRYRKVVAGENQMDSFERSIYIILRDVGEEGLDVRLRTQIIKNEYGAVEVNGSVTVTVPNLPPYSKLEFQIAVINKRRYGDLTAAITVDMKEGAPGPVDQLQITANNYGPTFVTLEWKRPIEPNGNITQYQVGFKKIKGLQLGPLEYPDKEFVKVTGLEENEDGFTSAKVTGLKPLQMYRFYVWAYTAAGQGSEDFLDDSTVAVGYPGAPRVHVDRRDDSSLLVTWDASTEGVPANVYYAQYKQKSAIDQWQRTGWEVTNDYIIIPNTSFADGWQYDIRVVASNGGIYETASESVSIFPSDVNRSVAEAKTVFGSSWFIGLLFILIFFGLFIALLVLIQKNKGGIYTGPISADEIEPLNSKHDSTHFDERPEPVYNTGDGTASERVAPSHYSDRYAAPSVSASNAPSERYIGSQPPPSERGRPSPGEDRKRPEADDFMQDDPSGYGEKASFIGQYNPQKELPNYRRPDPISEAPTPTRPMPRAQPPATQPRTRSIPSESQYTGVSLRNDPYGERPSVQQPTPRRTGTGAGMDYRPRNAPQPKQRSTSRVNDDTDTDTVV